MNYKNILGVGVPLLNNLAVVALQGGESHQNFPGNVLWFSVDFVGLGGCRRDR